MNSSNPLLKGDVLGFSDSALEQNGIRKARVDMSEHTKEPWSSIDSGKEQLNNVVYYIAAPTDQMNGGFFIAEVSGADKEANAQRIVACVNACEGISTEMLEQVGKLITPSALNFHQLKTQRDELIKSLKYARRSIRAIKREQGKYDHGRDLCIAADKRITDAIKRFEP